MEIQKKGASQAYLNIVKIYKNKPLEEQHFALHIFGEVLYEMLGINGFKVCDDSFYYGCYHGFMGTAIAQNGIKISAKTGEACESLIGEKRLACFHGIGHGLTEYLGHTDAKLQKSLDTCGTYRNKTFIRACMSGAIMEYNIPTLISSNKATRSARPFDPTFPYSPCDVLSQKTAPLCYYQLPEWWITVLKDDYIQVGKLCSEIQNDEYKNECFKGIGNVITPLRKNSLGKILETCNLMKNEKYVMYCLSGAAKSLHTLPDPKIDWQSPCQTLSKELKAACLKETQDDTT